MSTDIHPIYMKKHAAITETASIIIHKKEDIKHFCKY